jgi:hypothetical protein
MRSSVSQRQNFWKATNLRHRSDSPKGIADEEAQNNERFWRSTQGRIGRLGRGAGQADCVEVLAKQTNECERLNWLGGRDSNPDNRVQSAVSYR